MQTVITKEFVAVMAAPAIVDGTSNRIVQVILVWFMVSTRPLTAPDVIEIYVITSLMEILKKGQIIIYCIILVVFYCSSDMDCSDKGICNNEACDCNPGWDTEFDCSGNIYPHIIQEWPKR